MRAGVYLYGLATAAAGLMDLIWGEFESAHQPIQAWGDHISGQQIFAYITAVWLIVAGATILWRRTARAGAAALAILYFIFAVFWLPRFYSAPHILGFRIPVFLGVSGGVAQQLVLVAGAAIVYVSAATRASEAQRADLVVRWTFGLCSLIFGANHLTGVHSVAAFVPSWMPFGGDFWTALSGIAFVLAGIAILSGVLDVLASRLLAMMLLIFSAIVLAPMVFASPRDHVAWGSNAYNLAAVGAVWIFGDSIANRRAQREQRAHLPLAEVS